MSKAYMSRLVAWNNGEYIGEDGILCYYAKHRDKLVAELSKDFELVDDDVPLGNEDQIAWYGDEGP